MMTALSKLRGRSARRELRLFVRLVDGSLPERERAAAEAYLARDPETRRELARQRRLLAGLRAGRPAMPETLGRRIDEAGQSRLGQNSHQNGRYRHGVGARRRPLGAPQLAVCAIAVVVVLVAVAAWRFGVVAIGGNAPSVSQTAMLALRPATDPPPPPDAAHPTLLREQFGGVTFPDYRAQFAADATGQRTDPADGRTIRTVYYTLRGGTRISYSVISGRALVPPASARRLKVAGVTLRSYAANGLSIVTLVRHGRTCVLAGKVALPTIVALASAPLRSQID
jgi:hypothetical protein